METLKKFRKYHNMSQAVAAETLGYNVRTWQDYETGRRTAPKHLIKGMIHYSKAHTTVSGKLIVHHDDKVLAGDHWETPGGKRLRVKKVYEGTVWYTCNRHDFEHIVLKKYSLVERE